MRERELPFFRLAFEASEYWATYFKQPPLGEDKLKAFRRESATSLQRQRDVEAGDSVDFETFLENYYRQYDSL